MKNLEFPRSSHVLFEDRAAPAVLGCFRLALLLTFAGAIELRRFPPSFALKFCCIIRPASYIFCTVSVHFMNSTEKNLHLTCFVFLFFFWKGGGGCSVAAEKLRCVFCIHGATTDAFKCQKCHEGRALSLFFVKVGTTFITAWSGHDVPVSVLSMAVWE